MKLLKIILKYKYFPIIFLLITFLLAILRINNIKSMYYNDENFFELMVLDVKLKDNKYYIEFMGKEKLIGYYDNFPYDIGDILVVEGQLEEIKNSSIPNTFNYIRYQKSQNNFYQLAIKKIKLKKKNTNIFFKIKKMIFNRINKFENKEYIYTFLLGDTFYLNNNVKTILQSNGISYFLSIGSLQIYFLMLIFEKIRKICQINDKLYLAIICFILIFYVFLVDMKIGIIRSVATFIFQKIKNIFKLKMKRQTFIIWLASILLFINPLYLLNNGFYYSFIVGLGISIFNKNQISKIKYISMTLKCCLLSMPITIFFNYEYNFLSIILSILLAPYLSYFLFPFSIIVFFFPFLNKLFSFFVSIFELINNFFNGITIFTFSFRKMNLLIIVLYYLIIFLVFRNRKYIVIFVIILFLHININGIIKENFVSFLDVGQGDSIVIKDNNSLYLIDTGGSMYHNYSDNIIRYIKSLGINQINKLILTHGDYDHMGEAIDLVNNFKVEKVIFNCGPYNDLESELIKVLDKKRIKYYSCIKELNIDKNKLYFLQTKVYDNENDNSNVIYTELNSYKFMFMGDASVTTEKEILSKYNLPDIDILKVGHHGSKTSSSIEFIDEINPKYSIISVGKNNKYGHPNKEVINNLKDSKIYRTDEDGSIMFKIKNNKLKIETCNP